jgi:exosome complex component RRP4
MSESKLLVQDKSVVIPGEALAEGMEYFPGIGTYRHEDKILANQLGLLTIEGKVLKTTPLAGRYLPAKNDIVIGRVIDILMSGWRVDINCPYSAVIPLKDATFEFIKKGDDLTNYFALEDYVVCKVTQVTSQNLIDVSMKGPSLKKLRGGQFLTVNAAKVPRIIGRRGSMITMVKHATGCQIIVGQNGLVWISGEPDSEVIAVDAIRKIEREAHISGLTERVKIYLEQRTGKTLDMEAITREAEAEAAAAEAKPRFFRDENTEGYRDRPPRRDGDRGGYRGGDRGDRGGFRGRGDRPPRRDGDRPPRRDFAPRPPQGDAFKGDND